MPSFMEVAREVTAQHQAAKHDGVLIDAQTAAVLVAVHDGLNPVNQASFAALPVERAAKIAWRLAS